ncbi:MAG: alanine racemase [Fimbriimonadales bacterium]|nr:Alanine racemase [bacterium HR14]GIV14481.1 MAG: alanine racemase [Fimbriimonadales bacterium]CUU34085.1 alanine racemase [Armatimonadetes bacterium GXS]
MRATNWLEIDLSALRENAQQVQAYLGDSCALWAVIKADAYGHGATEVARALTALPKPPQRLIVASLEEAINLREAGIEAPMMMMLYPPLESEAWRLTHRYRLEGVIDSLEGYRLACKTAQAHGIVLDAHLEIDTGMSRLGLRPESLCGFLEEWEARAPIRWRSVFTHFANADSDLESTRAQLRSFLTALERLREAGFPQVALHASASAGLLNLPESHLDAVRCGLLLYGVAPRGAESHPLCERLRPVLRWQARVLSVRTIPKGQGVSYGWRYRAPRTRRIATLGVGYADGYPIHLTNRAEVLIRGRRVRQVGRVCMDMLMVDVSDLPEVAPGEVATLIGREGEAEIRVEHLAAWLNTTPHEITTRLGQRPPRLYRG